MDENGFQQALRIARARTKMQADAAAANAPTVGQDIMQTAPSYLARGTAGALDALAGGTIPGMIAQGADWLMSPEGTGGHPISEVANQAAPNFMSQEAKTTPGKFAGAVAEGAPYALAGGGSPVRSIISNVAGSVGGEAAAEAAKGGPLENFARLFGNLAGGAASAGRPGNLRPGVRAANRVTGVLKPGRATPMTGEELKAATDFAAQSLRDANIHYDPNEFAMLGPQMVQQLESKENGFKRGMTPATPQQKEAFDIADSFTRRAGEVPDYSSLDRDMITLSQKVRDANRAGDTELAKALGVVQDQLDQFMTSNNKFASMGPGAPKTAEELSAATRVYKDLAKRNIKQRRVQEALTDAENDPSGFTVGINRQLKKLIMGSREKKMFSPGELRMLHDVATTKSPITILTHFGLDFGRNAGLNLKNAALIAGATGSAYAAPVLGTVLGAAAPFVVGPAIAAGTGAKMLEGTMKRRNVEAAAGTIRGFEGQAPGADLAGQGINDVKNITNWAKLRWLMLGAQGSAPQPIGAGDTERVPKG